MEQRETAEELEGPGRRGGSQPVSVEDQCGRRKREDVKTPL
jgi:hypothetical protein